MRSLFVLGLLALLSACGSPSTGTFTETAPASTGHVQLAHGIYAKDGMAFVEGDIDYDMARGLQYGINTGLVTEAVLIMYSPGGYAEAGIQMGRSIRAAGLNTALADYCYSACVSVFVGGYDRLAYPSAEFGIHRRSLDGQDVGYGSYASDYSYYKSMGAPDVFIEIMYDTPSDEMTTFTGAYALGFGMVTSLM